MSARKHYIDLYNMCKYNITTFALFRFDNRQHIMTEAVIDLNALRVAADEACRVMKTLSNPDRLLLLCQLAGGEKCVSDLEMLTDITQPTLSQQLGVLRTEGLVTTRRDGKKIFYQISSPQTLAIMEVLYQQFCPTATEH